MTSWPPAAPKAKPSAPETQPPANKPAVDRAKHALGERGPAWWNDGSPNPEPDWNRHLARNTPYAAWFAHLDRAPS